MIATQITTHVQDALNRLLQQYKGLPGIEGFFTALVEPIQELENAISSMDQLRQLQFASGQQLDNLGTLIGLPRNGLDDATYFIFLVGTIAENFSDTTPDALLNIVQTLFQCSTVFVKTPNSPGVDSPAQVAFGVGDPLTSSSLYNRILQIIQSAGGAAVRLNYVSSFEAEGCFATAGQQNWTRQSGPSFTPSLGNPWPFGFGDLNNAYVGGGYASLVQSQGNVGSILLEDGERLLDESGGVLETEG